MTLGCYFGALHSGRTLTEGAVGSYYSQQLALVGLMMIHSASCTIRR
ncbi:hypothetical protein [Pantoea phytobeneficialis]|uniref:Uncharacterized protein n=1 Tax=Pantoea phytobeneficialis TaxID=2052056 RepID=A0ABT8XRM3_9GAMM|nr:hypothetical protein [Pantoea phytobeneficialis]MDO6406087.1 hypothetical protein [Pantoea phytobeneficialis]